MIKRTMKFVDIRTGRMVCETCGSEHYAFRNYEGGYRRGAWQCRNSSCPAKRDAQDKSMTRPQPKEPVVVAYDEAQIRGIRERIQAFERAMTADEVATLFSINLQTVYNQTRAGKLPHFRIGTSVRFDPKGLYEWFEKQAIG